MISFTLGFISAIVCLIVVPFFFVRKTIMMYKEENPTRYQALHLEFSRFKVWLQTYKK